MFKEWEQKAKKKYMYQGELLPPQMRHMIAYNGLKDGETCGSCQFLETVREKGRVKFECVQQNMIGTNRRGKSPFQPGWPACGLHNKKAEDDK